MGTQPTAQDQQGDADGEGDGAEAQHDDPARSVAGQVSAALLSAEGLPAHPDGEVILSFPGLGTQFGARVLAEIGDDRERFSDARRPTPDARRPTAYAGSPPITRVFGKKSAITRRWVKNDRLKSCRIQPTAQVGGDFVEGPVDLCRSRQSGSGCVRRFSIESDGGDRGSVCPSVDEVPQRDHLFPRG
ncbi:transposase [Streptomyces sp. NPDC058861]|uniref:transposase n=1 Tax=Streptomyces sp. NPDC058861 TaxID=3346653 RepID=UPI0036A626B0